MGVVVVVVVVPRGLAQRVVCVRVVVMVARHGGGCHGAELVRVVVRVHGR